jgi:prepilin-type N-terminal cleavage/methylation domain-containing protein
MNCRASSPSRSVRSFHRGFTLIELLVVITIIAILAAILFPVFAQAKAAAKATAILSNSKQMGTAQLIYGADHDDRFAPIAEFKDGFSLPSFATVIEPYIKNFGIFMDPLTPAKPGDNPFILNSQWAMAPSRAAVASCPTSDTDLSCCAFGSHNALTRSRLTGGVAWGRDGIAGASKSLSGGFKTFIVDRYRDAASMTQSEVNRVSETLLVTQSGMFDMLWGSCSLSPDRAFRHWGDAVFNLYGNQNVTAGPMPRVGANGRGAGIWPVETVDMTEYPTGRNISVYADGHAKTRNWSEMHSKSVDGPGGTKYLAYAAPRF